MRWIIGDIHGMAHVLDALLAAIDLHDSTPHYYFVGDYINRGPNSRQVIDRLLTLPRAHFARGNHDDVFDIMLRGASSTEPAAHHQSVTAFTSFMQHGLAETLLSYGVEHAILQLTLQKPSVSRVAAICQAVPIEHQQFIHRLPVVIEEPDFFVAHAYWPPMRPNLNPSIAQQIAHNQSLATNLLWSRFEEREILQHKAWDRPGYFGHTPVNNYSTFTDFFPIAADHIVLLDTASALHRQGMLTAVCAETGEFLQASRQGQIRSSAEMIR